MGHGFESCVSYVEAGPGGGAAAWEVGRKRTEGASQEKNVFQEA